MQKKKQCAKSKNFLGKKKIIGRKDGITLIALVVTIIILLILAGVALTAMVNGGIFDKAKEATTKTQIGKEKEQIATSYAKYKMESTQGIETTLTVEGASVTGNDADGWTITFEDTGNTYKIHPDGKVEETGKVEEEPPAEPTDIYVTLYADGTLGFSNNEEKIEGKTVSKSYENIKGKTFTYNGAPWYADRESITTVEIQNEIVPINNTANWFAYCSNLKQINNISNINLINVVNLDSMFYNCSSLTELDLRGWNTVNVQNMLLLFYQCSSLIRLDVSSFNTSNVTNMEYMFCGCKNLKELNIKNFNTKNVTNMRTMFNGCSSLTELDLSSFDTSNVTNMEAMFSGCSSLTELNLSNFNTSKVTNMSSMFSNLRNFERIRFKKF